MARWTLDEVAGLLVRLRRTTPPGPLAERLDLDALRLGVHGSGREGVELTIVERSRTIGCLTVETTPANKLRAETRAALASLAVETGCRTDACGIYWSFSVERKGEGIGLLLAAAGAAWSARHGLAVTGGAGLLRGSTSEMARTTYQRLGTLLPRATLPPEFDYRTLAPALFVPAGDPNEQISFVLPDQADLHEEDLARSRAYLLAMEEALASPRTFVATATRKAMEKGGVLPQLDRHLRYLSYRNAPLQFRIHDFLRALRYHVRRSEAAIGTSTTRLSPLAVLFGGPLVDAMG